MSGLASVQTLFEPVAGLLATGLEVVGGLGDLTVELGEVEGFARLEGDRLLLSAALADGVAHPDELAAPFGLDRWRRALLEVLDACARRAAGATDEAWWSRGLALDRVDTALPALGLAVPALVHALEGDLVGHPRSGVAVIRAWRSMGLDPVERAVALRAGEGMRPEAWMDLARRVLDPTRGVGSWLPVPAERPAPRDIPLTLGPWRWQPLLVPAHRRGGEIRVEGDGLVDHPWAPAGAPHRALAVSVGGCRLSPALGGPVGPWEVASAEGFGQVLGVRGVVFDLKGSGRLELVLANAFAGPLAAVAMSESVGTSGVVTGRWEVAGPRSIAFRDLDARGLTLHGKGSDVALPAGGAGMAPWVSGLQESPWRWQEDEGRLRLAGRLMGDEVEIRLRRSAP